MNLDHILIALGLSIVLTLVQTARAAYWKGKYDGLDLANESHVEENGYLRELHEADQIALRDAAFNKEVAPLP